jgi:hypothetical protein
MKTNLLFIIALFFLNSVEAQDDINAFQLDIGKSWHGTGDLDGMKVEVSYEHNFSRRLSLSNAIATTIHYGKDRGFNALIPGISPEANLMRFTTAGIQYSPLINFAVFSRAEQKIKLSGGAVCRFQSTSLPNLFGYHQDGTGNTSQPYYIIYDHTNHNSISVGYAAEISYVTQATKKWQIGVKAAFQNDTNSDAITSVSLILGRILPRLK